MGIIHVMHIYTMCMVAFLKYVPLFILESFVRSTSGFYEIVPAKVPTIIDSSGSWLKTMKFRTYSDIKYHERLPGI